MVRLESYHKRWMKPGILNSGTIETRNEIELILTSKSRLGRVSFYSFHLKGITH